MITKARNCFKPLTNSNFIRNTSIVLIILGLIVSSCRNKTESQIQKGKCEFNPAMRPLVFDTGTIWVYEQIDHAGNRQTDTQRIVASNYFVNHIQQKGLDQLNTGYQMIIYSSLRRTSFNMFAVCSGLSGEPDYSGLFFEWMSDTSTSGNGIVKYSQYYDSLILNNNIFYNVRKSDRFTGSNSGTKLFSVWVCPNVGIIKWEEYNDTLTKSQILLINHHVKSYPF